MDATPRVLVVDDEPVNVKLLEWMLKDAGFLVDTALCGPDGRALALAKRPDLIVLDVMMPGEDGFATCAALKAEPATLDIPVIFISGVGEVDFKVQGLQIGGVDYITKPFAKEEVLARVKLHIKLRQANQALIQAQAAKINQIRDAQQAILVKPEDLPEAGFAVAYTPVLEAGGDFYDVFPVSGKEFGYFVADVSGHDLAASFTTSSLKALVRQNTGPLYSPEETFRNINAVLRVMFKDGRHLTASQVRLNRAKLTVTVINAGHPPPVLVSAGKDLLLESRGDLLGVFESVQLDVLTLRVAAGDRIFLYTDGLIEDFAGRVNRDAGLEALCRACRETTGLPLTQAITEITGRLASGRPGDDVVLLGLEV
ncbi:MAG: fused response regulator/phosphatase [Desulfovibrionaceae bacterium]|nr:fused response regulator/phosphatase [Desulfovibrionaceae bacterium]MBF0513701.1 fused response regulator/phosphatase [Desulfovibrionaceae bacterium]